jgi:hypothetical protein
MSRYLLLSVLALLALLNGACATHTKSPPKGVASQQGDNAYPAAPPISYNGPQYMVAITSFGNAVPDRIPGWGQIAADILKTELEASGLSVVELDKPALGTPASTSPSSNSAVTNLVDRRPDIASNGFDYLLSGQIKGYSEVEEGIDAIRFQQTSIVSRVTLEYALVDVASGRILDAGPYTGQYRKITPGASDLGAKSVFDPDLLEGALRDALYRTSEKVVRKLSAVPFHGILVDVNGNSVLLRAGSRSQLKLGTPLAVYRRGEALQDAITGQPLGYKEQMIGIITVNDHRNESISEATILSGTDLRKGDIARPLP